jgi:hypothetical protein
MFQPSLTRRHLGALALIPAFQSLCQNSVAREDKQPPYAEGVL